MFAPINLVLFTNDASEAEGMMDKGIHNFLIDWEIIGKDERQKGFDTEVRPGTLNDLKTIAAISGAITWCRLNPFGPHTAEEVSLAIDANATILLLPMVEQVKEVESFLDFVAGRALCGILIETPEALALGKKLANLPLDYAYFGLNDFAIRKGYHSIFQALLDGSVASARDLFWRQQFGFGGLTDIRKGFPIPTLSLLQEMAKLKCNFSFLRRSFRRDTNQLSVKSVVNELQIEWQYCMTRNLKQIERAGVILESYINAC